MRTRTFWRPQICVRIRRNWSVSVRVRLRVRTATVAHFGEVRHGRNFGWTSASLNTLLVSDEEKKYKMYDCSENRNLHWHSSHKRNSRLQ